MLHLPTPSTFNRSGQSQNEPRSHFNPTSAPTNNSLTLPLDQAIILKCGVSWPHVHRYNLRIKVKKTDSEEEELTALWQALQKFLDIALQADPSSIIPPFFALDRNDRTVPDLSSTFPLTSLDSLPLIKHYFSKLSTRNDKGNVYCSLVLAQSVSFHEFMDKACSSLINLD